MRCICGVKVYPYPRNMQKGYPDTYGKSAAAAKELYEKKWLSGGNREGGTVAVVGEKEKVSADDRQRWRNELTNNNVCNILVHLMEPSDESLWPICRNMRVVRKEFPPLCRAAAPLQRSWMGKRYLRTYDRFLLSYIKSSNIRRRRFGVGEFFSKRTIRYFCGRVSITITLVDENIITLWRSTEF